MILVMLLSKHSCKIYHVCILIYLCTPFVYTIPDVDRDIYEEGKKQYRTITEHSKYGPCWKDTLIKLEKGCKEITDTVQLKLAVHYLNCFLDMQNRTIYPCDDRDDTVHCTQNLSDTDRTSLTTFFAHTYSICYFIRAHSWHDETVRTMEQLLHNSQKVTSQLEYLSTLQNQMIAKQSETLKIQDDVLNKSSNINITLSDKILPFLNELNETAHLHKEYTSSVYADILNMFRSVFGKYNWIYSVISHVPFAFAIFIVTGTEETRVARPWMIFVLLLNFFIEVFIFGFAIQVFSWIPQGIYTQLHNVCRIAAVMSIIVIWMVFCIRYRKIPDNHMLENMHEDIKKLRQAFEEFHKSMQNQLPAGSSGVTGQNPTQDSGSVTSKTTPRRKTRTPQACSQITTRRQSTMKNLHKSQGPS